MIVELGLHGIKQLAAQNGGLFPREDLALEDDLADIEPVAQKMGERTSGERNPPDRSPALECSQLGDNPPLPEIGHQAVEAAKPEIAAEDGTNPLGLLINHHDLAVLGRVSERHDATHPEPLALGGGDLVADALRGDLALELGKR